MNVIEWILTVTLNMEMSSENSKYFNEIYYLNSQTNLKKFNVDFLRSHMKRPELSEHISTIDHVIKYQKLLRMPKFIIARKKEKYWKITEKIFIEELR